MEPTGQELVGFWDWVASRGLMNANSAQGLGTACKRILAVEENWEQLDVSTLDVDALIGRFSRLKAKDFQPGTLREYGKRFRLAHASFLEHVRDPEGWTAPRRERQSGVPNGRRAERDAQDVGAKAPSASQMPEPPAMDARSGKMIVYPFPLREDIVATLTVPRDLTVSEATRLGRFINALAIDAETACAA
ncbi:MAG: hypothetical protein HYU66_23145 [Armatimonadetes bacterium]|nr:hypothetical protein [Armatimonadota bacterium]